jgi:diguanylate cyclase (GGDEF)-like protein
MKRLKRAAPQFGTRITRRMIALFMLCALLPVAATLLLAYDRVQSTLLSQRIALLRGAADAYGVSLIDRLSVTESLGATVAAELAAGRPFDGAAYAAYFRSASPLLLPATSHPASGPVAAEGDLPGTRRLHVARSRTGDPAVWLVVRGAAGPPVALEIDPKFLWRDDTDLPFGTDVCVLGSFSFVLHCSRPLSEVALLAVRKRIAEQGKGEVDWQDDGKRHLSSFSEIFLRGRYATDSWTVIATQPEEQALAPVEALKHLIAPVVVLGLLFAALLGLVQVRRTLGPLKELSDATARIAVRDFDVRLDVKRDDEFGALAHAFNTMCARLAAQFKALLAHAEIDAVILSSVDLPRIASIVLKRTGELVACDRRFLVLADPSRPDGYGLFSESPDGQAGEPLQIGDDDARRLLASTNGVYFAVSDTWARIAALAHLPGRNLFVMPIPLGSELGGAIILGYDDERRPGGGDLALLWKLADRVAVALATAKRDLELHRRAYYDALTQLPNRVLGMEELERTVAHAARHGHVLAVLFVDLDGFSDVNDSLGHQAGDDLLAQAAARLRASVRKSDIISRLGGDEFAVILPELADAAGAAVVAGHLIAQLSEPFKLAAGEAFISASVGIAVYPTDAAGAEELLRNADLAMYNAKQAGRGQVAFFQAAMNQEVRRRVELERELREALEARQFELHFQPQLDLRSGRIGAAEALVRWRHPQRGLVPPVEFIPFAETSGLIEPLGRWVLEAACAQLAEWRAQQLPVEYVSVNVSPRQFRRAGLPALVAEILQRHQLPPAALHLEITESALFDDQPGAAANFTALTSLGLQLELDDFGTGYSSLARLQHVPVAAVKLDRSFVEPIERDPGARAVARAAIEMAHALGKYVVAEGVEEAGQLALLQSMRCDLAQGYYLSQPMPAQVFAQFVRKRAEAPSRR